MRVLTMKLSELKTVLGQNPAAHLCFILPNGSAIPAHAHVSDVARVEKRFIDCGGTLRTETLCRLQTWHSDDVDHRLTAGKLQKILRMAETVLGPDDLDVDTEHQLEFISQFPVESVEATPEKITFHLTVRRTACLAEDRCKPRPLVPVTFDVFNFNPRAGQSYTGCCADSPPSVEQGE
jgi:hypothetical protein